MKRLLSRIYIIHRARWGVLFHLTSLWIGVHYSKEKKRTCINLIPSLTLWFIKKDGTRP